MAMEKDKHDKLSHAWCLDDHTQLISSHWLRHTLSDLENNTEMMLSILQEGGDSFAERAEMYYKKRHDLTKMLKDFNKSFQFLAGRYIKLESDYVRATRNKSVSASSCSLKEPESSNPDSLISKVTETSNSSSKEIETSDCNFDLLSEIDMDTTRNSTSDDEDGIVDVSKKEKIASDLSIKVSSLLGDNMRYQEELIKRNNEKREAIRDLYVQINRLKDENKALKDGLTLACYNGKKPKSKAFFLGKYLNCTDIN